ncbi:PAS domain-containing protein [Prosthecomicrobium sp. N25]|uniref:PAS domain-containing protein n=1 Tax=Prosthecomicrobium sp. N25 TaxID=3129254 RepID=UPI003077C1E0
MVICDPFAFDMPVLFASPAFYDFTLYDRGDVIGRNCRFLQGKGTDPIARLQLGAGLAAQARVIVRILNYKADGTPFWNALDIRPMLDPRDRLACFVGFQNPEPYTG